MPFPFQDPAWSDVASFLRVEVRPDERVVAPDLFWVVLPVLHRYRDTWRNPDGDPDWLVVHKGDVGSIEPGVLRRTLRDRPPALANDVFVVFGPERCRERAVGDDRQVHVRALVEVLERTSDTAPRGEDPVLPDPGVIEHFARFDITSMKAAMDAFYEAGGYQYPTRRDQLYDAELDRLFLELVGPPDGRRRLDLASGLGRTARVAGTNGQLVLSDVSEVAMKRCRDAFHPVAGCVVMDAAAAAVRSETFDDVVLCDAFEHVSDPVAVLAEAHRVLRPAGRLFVTANNRNSLNLRLTRALGNPEFVTNYQHITEIAYEDLCALLDDVGFDVVESRGLFLFPYWGVPGVDEHVRAVMDEDPELVEITRELGELAGARHAFVAVVMAEKVP